MKIVRRLVLVALAIAALVAFLNVGIQEAQAASYYINGTITRGDNGNPLGGVVVANSTNTSQTSTTDSTYGFFNISNFANSSEGSADGLKWLHNLTVTPSANYIGATITFINISDADNSTKEYTNLALTVRTPLNSAITEASITRDSATISWTVNLSTDNRLKYSIDSGIATNYFYTAWSNTTASPSFKLLNLRPNNKYYYQVESYNTVSSSYRDLDTGDLTTLKAGTTSYYTPGVGYVTPGATVAPKATPKPIISIGGITIAGSSNTSTILFLLFVAVVAIVYFGFIRKGGKQKGRSRKK